MDNSILELIFGFLDKLMAIGSSLFMFVSPMCGRTAFRRIVMTGCTEQFSGIPYVMILLNCLLYLWYGLPFVSPKNEIAMSLSPINGAGAIIESLIVMIFLIYAPKHEKRKILGLLGMVLTLFVGVAFVSAFALHGHDRKVFSGIAAAVPTIIMHASPLTVIMLVVRTKSVEFMPFYPSLSAFLCGTCLFIFGLLGNDLFIVIPNGFGSILGAVQLLLYVKYHERIAQPESPGAANGSLEMVKADENLQHGPSH